MNFLTEFKVTATGGAAIALIMFATYGAFVSVFATYEFIKNILIKHV